MRWSRLIFFHLVLISVFTCDSNTVFCVSLSGDCYADNPSICQELHVRIEGRQEAIRRKRAIEEAVVASDATDQDSSHRSLGLKLPQRYADLADKRGGYALEEATSPNHRHVGRRLSAPVPIRISPQFQLPAAMPAATQTLVQQIIWAAIKTMQVYVKV